MKKFFTYALFVATLSFLFFACGGKHTPIDTGSKGTGGLAVALQWPSSKYAAPAGVATIRISISGSDMATITQDFPAADGGGTISGVLAGTNRTVSALGLDANGTTLYSGSTSGVTIVGGQTTNVVVVLITAADPIDTIMPNAKLIEKVATGSSVDLNGVTTLTGGSQNGNYVVWTKTFNDFGSSDLYTSFPSTLTLRFAIDATGNFYVGAEGSDPDVLSVLTDRGLSNNFSATWGYPIQSVTELNHSDTPLRLDNKTNILVELLYLELRDIVEAGYTTGGPQLVCADPYGCSWGKVLQGFDTLSFSLKSNYTQPIATLASAIRMIQSDTQWACGCPFDGISFLNGPWWTLEDTTNKMWNPKATDTTDGSGTRSFSLSYSGGTASYYTARADGDNSNSGYVKIDGSTVTSFSNWDSSAHAYRVANSYPTSVEIGGTNSWSAMQAYFRIAVLGGTISVGNVSESPTGGMDNNPAPLTYTINPGWN